MRPKKSLIAQADLCWSHKSNCRFHRVLAHFIYVTHIYIVLAPRPILSNFIYSFLGTWELRITRTVLARQIKGTRGPYTFTKLQHFLQNHILRCWIPSHSKKDVNSAQIATITILGWLLTMHISYIFVWRNCWEAIFSHFISVKVET